MHLTTHARSNYNLYRIYHRNCIEKTIKGCRSCWMKGDTAAALDQINLAEIKLSLLNMGSQETAMN
jgi:hypothetical protein